MVHPVVRAPRPARRLRRRRIVRGGHPVQLHAAVRGAHRRDQPVHRRKPERGGQPLRRGHSGVQPDEVLHLRPAV